MSFFLAISAHTVNQTGSGKTFIPSLSVPDDVILVRQQLLGLDQTYIMRLPI